MRQTAALHKMASTHGGMRNILKQKPSAVQFLKWSVETGIHKDLPQNQPQKFNRYNNNNNNNNNRRNKGIRYPIEYELLTLNPPIPEAPRIPKKMQRKEQSSLPTDQLVKSYMRRYDARMKAMTNLTDAEKEQYYYRKTLGIDQKSDASMAMGRKSAVLSHAYEFALRQFQVMQQDPKLSEEDSIDVVEELLREEEKLERLSAREKVTSLKKEKEAQKQTGKGGAVEQDDDVETVPTPSSTIPSILHSKPRTIQALNIWGKRLQAVPYSQWTLGASTALDHWIAVDVLGMSEETWNRLLDGEFEADVEASRGTEDLNIGDLARHKDFITVRSTLFPETIMNMMDDDESDIMDMDGDEAVDEQDDTDRSIEELLASLGGLYEEESDAPLSADDKDDRITAMIHSLQDWRAKNMKKDFADWESSEKDDFNKWLADYISTVAPGSEGSIDVAATREALLSEPPKYHDEADAFWSRVSDETDAEILLHNITKDGAPAASENETSVQKSARKSLESFLSLPYPKQLKQLISLGALRPILDEYSCEDDRTAFFERYGETLLEGMSMEHLVSDPEGAITADEIGDDSLLSKLKVQAGDRFSIKMVPYGTDEYGLSRSEKARALYRAWNVQKAGRARYAEQLYKTGKMSLENKA